MGYTTTLYAVELETLRSAIGSNDPKLRKKLLPKADAKPKPLVALVTLDGEILLNGKSVSDEEFRAAAQNPEIKAGKIVWYQRQPRKRNADEMARFAASRFAEIGSFARFLFGILEGSGIDYIHCTNSEKSLQEVAGDLKFCTDQAVEHLLRGECTEREHRFEYGYALERMCGAVGKRVAVIEGRDRLKPLKLKTPLSKDRIPEFLPPYRDFPYLSYLTPDEVHAEQERLKSSEPAPLADPSLEQDRQQFFKAIGAAAKSGKSVMSFYY